MSIGQVIKLYRKEKCLTQSELAELIGVSVQAVSKWETNVGMPDISQIVPLARVLEITTDKLLGYTDEAFESEVAKIREQVGGINLISDLPRAKRIYELATQFFNKHPDVPDIALVCLECLTELIAQQEISKDKSIVLAECERYGNSIFRYETDADQISKAHYLMSRAYDLFGENEKSEEMLSRLPFIFGDRSYWEAEMAYANKKYDLALLKVKESFALKARFISRCIRMVVWITQNTCQKNTIEKCIELNEYMLRIINAFLSGGDYLPYRQIFQKTSLLCVLVQQYADLGNVDKAKEHLQELLQTREKFFEFLDDQKNKHCLMFIEGDKDGFCGGTKEAINEINEIIVVAENALKLNRDE